MSKILWKSLLFSPAILGATLLASTGAIAAEKQAPSLEPAQFSLSTGKTQPANSEIKLPTQVAAAPSAPAVVVKPMAATTPSVVVPPANLKVAQNAPASENVSVLEQLNRYSNEGNGGNSRNLITDNITNVSQFSDVKPTDWAYSALRDLVERYGCIQGYPDGFFRGNRAMTRYEFAAGLNSCLKQVEKLIASVGGDWATKEDLEKLRRLVSEFQAELATLGTRVDKLEGRVQFLEDHQFSTTTKLVGEAIFAFTSPLSTVSGSNTVLADRVRLDLQTSFTGKDVLHTRLAAGSTSALINNPNITNAWSGSSGTSIYTHEGTQTFDLSAGSNNVVLDWLAYEFPFQNSKVYLAAVGGLHSDYAPTVSPYFDDGDGGRGALSTFAQYSPIYRIGGGAGAGVRFSLGGPSKSVLLPSSLTFGYLAENGNLPNNTGTNVSATNQNAGNGLLVGNYSALAQLNFTISDRFSLAATYINGYHADLTKGIFDSSNPAGSAATVGSAIANLRNDTRFNSTLRNGRAITNSYGLEAALRLGDGLSISGFAAQTNVRYIGLGDGEIWTFGGGIALPDFGKKGNLLGLFVGAEPTLRGATINNGAASAFERDFSFHYEAFYKYQLTDNISITPGVIWLTAPNQRDINSDAWIGTLRTTFSF